MLPPNNSYYSAIVLLIPTVRAIAIHGSVTIDGGREEIPPPPKRDGGGICRVVVRSPAVAVARHTRARPPPLGPPTGPSHQRCRPPLPPACTEPHPPRLVPPGLDLRPPHPHQESHKPPCRPPPPSPPHGDNNTADQRSVEATRDLSPEDVRPQATLVRVVVVPAVQGGGGEGAEHSALSLPGSCSRSVGYLRTVIPHRVVVVGGSAGGAPAAAVAEHGGRLRKRQRWL